MMPVIRVDNDVHEALKRRAVELDMIFGSPNDVLRYDYVGITKAPVHNGGQPKGVVEIELKDIYTPRRWALIPIPKGERSFFPGYKVAFELITDVGTQRTRVTSSQTKGTPVGDPGAGRYIQGNLRDWFDQHPELKPGDKLRFEVLEAGKRYKLSIIPSQ
jgi:hypothetical protein